MFVASKIILKSALLAAGAATPFIAATPTGSGSTQPAFSPAARSVQTQTNLKTPPHAPTAPGWDDLLEELKTPNSPYTRIAPVIPGGTAPRQSSLAPRTLTPNMTHIPQSYEIYLLHRSDGVLIGPNGVVPLKPSMPKNILIESEKKP